MKRLLLLSALLLAGCDDSPPKTYTVTASDGTTFRGMKYVWGGKGSSKFKDRHGRGHVFEGNHHFVEETDAEMGGESR